MKKEVELLENGEVDVHTEIVIAISELIEISDNMKELFERLENLRDALEEQ